MTDPLLPPETFSDAMDEAEKSLGNIWTGHAPSVDDQPGRNAYWVGGYAKGVPTIDRALPPVDAAPKPKGPPWRLAELRASSRRLEMRRGER